MTILETIAARRSVRSFDGQDLSPRDQARLSELFADAKNPYPHLRRGGRPEKFAVEFCGKPFSASRARELAADAGFEIIGCGWWCGNMCRGGK